MRTQPRNLSPFVLTAALLLLALVSAGVASAQEPAQTPEPPADAAEATATTAPAESEEPAAEPAKTFTLRLDPLALGVIRSHVDTRSSKWEEYRDVSSGFVIPKLRLTGEGSGDRGLDFSAENLRRDDARYTLDYGIPGRYELSLDYNKIPHHFGNDGHMLWTRTGPGRLEIADPTQAALQGALAAQAAANPAGINFAFLDRLLAPYLGAAQSINLGLNRNRLLAQLDLGRMGPLSWALQYDHEKRTGNRAYGGSFGFSNATELPEPIDYDTTGAEVAGQWSNDRSGLRFGYHYSKFENNVSTLVWDNPFRITGATDPNAYTAPGSGSINGSNLGFADLAASNRADLLFVNGRTRFGRWLANGSASYDTMKQDDPLLPYTLNSSIVGINFNGATFDPTNPANLPARTANRKINTLALNADLGTQFGQSVDLTFRYRYYDLANKGSRLEFPGYVRFHAVWESIGRVTVPFGYTRSNASAELGWDLARATRLGFSVERETWEREFREIESSDEDIWKVTFDTRPSPKFSLRSSYQYGDRSIGHYDVEAAEDSFLVSTGATNLPALRKFDEAARKRSVYNVQGQFFPSDAWSLSIGVTGNDQDFDESLFGLQKDDSTSYSAELSYAPGDRLNLYLFGDRQDRKVRQKGRQSGAAPSINPLDDWTANFAETTDSLGLGLTAQLSGLWSADLSANWSRSDGEADLFSPPGGTPNVALGFDNYEDIELFGLLGRVDYKITPSAKTGLFYRWEEYKIDSFILQGLRNYLPGALLLNPNLGGYRGEVVGFDIAFTF